MQSFRPSSSHKSHRLTDFLRPSSARRRRAARARRKGRPVRLESLEQRLLLATTSVSVSKDNTLYESSTGDLSNGVGDHIFAGKTQTDGFIRRAVMAFDLESAGIPAGSTITDATLNLSVSRTPAGAQDTQMSLHKLLKDWGEGTSHAMNEEGQGIASTRRDATWQHTFWDTQDWDMLGGDFVPELSATAPVGSVGTTSTWSSDGLIADVQSWIDDPSSNFGWILVGDEASNGTARRFWSGDSLSGLNPRLDITFEPQTLNIVLNDTSISENGGSTMAAVTRTKTAGDLTVMLFSDDTTEATVTQSVVIPDGSNSSLPFPIDAVDDNILDGTQVVTFTASAPGHVSGVQMLAVTDYEPLTLSIADGSISENGGSTMVAVLRTDSSFPLTVDFFSDDTSEATVAPSVTLAVGETISAVTIDAVDDSLLDGTQLVTITAAANGFEPASGMLTVTDSEQLTVTIAADSIQEAGGTTGVIVTRTDPSGNLTVNLSSDDTGEATVAASVVIPDGQIQSPPVDISGVDDGTLDGTQIVTISATATGYEPGSDTLEVTDFGPLVLAISDPSISELSGSTMATVTRTNTAGDLTVVLASDDLGEATVPASIVILDGQNTSAPFSIDAVDDSILDGSQTVTISARASGHGSGFGTLSVSDFEALSVVIDDAAITENESTTTGTVTRTDTTGELTVSLAVDDPTGATVSASVVIADGQAVSPPFTISAVDDSVLDGTQTITVLATATGYEPGTETLDITDFEELAVTIDAAAISESGGSTTATVSRTDASGDLVVNLVSEDASEATVVASVTIPDGQLVSPPFAIDAVDDASLDGTQTVSVTASAAGYIDGSATLQVTDFEALQITIADGSISERLGETTGTVTRNDAAGDLLVLLTSDATDEATVAASVLIPDGQTSAAFDINSVDDQLLDGTQAVGITATATGYEPATATLDVTDFEALLVTLATNAIEENGGLTTATVLRPGTQGDLNVQLSTSDPGEATVIQSVTIANGLPSRNFLVRAQDDAELDGDQTVTVTVSAEGYIDGTVSINVLDDDTVTISLAPSRDNTLYENAVGARSNGVGDFLFAGRTGQPVDAVRRAVVGFDLSGEGIPAGAIVTNASFSLTVSQAPVEGEEAYAVHKLTQDWGEGTSHAGGQESGGSEASPGDATWLHTFYDSQQWSNPGGDFAATASATANVGGAGGVATWSSAALTADVQSWLETPDENFGWVVIGNETSPGTSRRFDSKDNPSGSAPRLELTYAPPTESLTLTPADASISENGGTTEVILSRSGNTTAAVTVSLLSDDASEAVVPASATIEAGASSTTVSVSAVDDVILDGTQAVTIRAMATGFVPASGVIGVTDFEPLSLSISGDTISEDGGVTMGTVTRVNAEGDLVVSLTSGDSTEASVPASIVIRSGQTTSDPFPITAVNDNVLDGAQTVSIIAGAPGYETGSDSLQVSDDDTTAVVLEGNVLTITGSARDDNLTLRIVGSNLVISDPFNALATMGLNLGDTISSSVAVPLTSIGGGVRVETMGGANSVRLAESVDDALADLISIVGGEDQDRLVLEGGGLTLDVTRYSNLDHIDMRGNGPNELVLAPFSVSQNAPAGLAVQADLDDVVDFGGGWRLNNTAAIDGVLYRVLVQGTAQFLLSGPAVWQNPIDPFDLNNDSLLSPIADVLASINELNVPTVISADGTLPLAPSPAVLGPNGPFHDTDGNGVLSPSDILARINRLHSELSAGEGEGESGGSPDVALVAESSLAAATTDSAVVSVPLRSNHANLVDGRQAAVRSHVDSERHRHLSNLDGALAELDSDDWMENLDDLSWLLD